MSKMAVHSCTVCVYACLCAWLTNFFDKLGILCVPIPYMSVGAKGTQKVDCRIINDSVSHALS
jgi:hypothetical protein